MYTICSEKRGRKGGVLLLLALCFSLTACARNGFGPGEANLEPVLTPDQMMAKFLGETPPGQSSVFLNTSFGDSVTVMTQDAYISGLGEFCRGGIATTSRGNTRTAACQDKKTQEWHMAPAIFGHGAL